MTRSQYLFYRKVSYSRNGKDVSVSRDYANPNYAFTLWVPSILRIRPKHVDILSPVVWWIFHHCRLFSNRDYGILVVLQDDTPVHWSIITPRYFRFPFMSAIDLQIGNTWTATALRGEGIASAALLHITDTLHLPGRCFWYLTDVSNLASQRVAEKAGFKLVGVGKRTHRFGIRAFGSFTFENNSLVDN